MKEESRYALLAGDSDELSESERLQRLEHFGNKWPKRVERIAFGDENDDTNGSARQVLLELDALINSDEGVELPCSGTEQRAVRQPSPARLYYGDGLVTAELRAESLRDAFIE